MQLPLIEKKQLVNGVWEFSFGLNGKKFHFEAGQYVRVVVPKLIKKDTKGPGRVFSIASSPNDKKKITIVFRVSESGYKQTLAQTKVGEKLEIEGPWGTLGFPEKTDNPLVFIAGGTGISPFLSMLRFAAEKHLKHNITLLYASRSAGKAIYPSDLKALKKQNPKLKIANIFGFINKSFVQKNTSASVLEKAIFYISGPISMMSAAIALLRDLGVDDERIYFEEWSEYVFKKIPEEIIKPTSDAVIFTDLNGLFRYVNPAWEKLTGWKSKEIIGKVTPRIVKSGVQNLAFYKVLWNKALAGIVYKFEAVNKKKNKTLFTIDEVSVPLRAQSGCIYGHSAFQRDITKQRKTEKDLEILTKNLDEKVKEQTRFIINEKARNDAILKNIGEGLGVVDKEMKTIMINRAAQDILGFAEKEAMGKVWPKLVSIGTDKIDELPLSESPLARAMEGKTVISGIAGPIAYYYRKKDKTRIPVSIVATPILLEGKIIGSIVVFRDITKEKEVDRTKSEFLALASHQLRTPLTGIKWVAELLLNKEQFTERGKLYITEINNSVRRLSTLVDSLLNVSRIEMGRAIVKVEPADAAVFVEDYIKQSEPVAAKKNIKIIFEKHPQELNIITDPVILYNILHTFVSNAVDYTPKDGVIELSLEKKEKTFIITVKDNGIGIPENEQKDIFKKFMRGSKARIMQPDGNGLGLYLALQMGKLLGDKIWFESEERKGTAFHIELPLESKPVSGEVRFVKLNHAK
ncbi:MAG: PAS domain S-box protein [Candidatus Nealsonbacteria bacterium]|nr:PAS domain S-box protein [Candidatus Nealsonbacteria bacterium]